MKRLIFLAALCLMLAAGARAEVYMQKPPADWADRDVLEWTVFDVNEGDAMLLRCGGESMMVDGGPAPFRDALCEAMDARGLRSMTYMLNTHYHDDHIDGLYYLLKAGFTAGEYLHGYSDGALESDDLGRRTAAAARQGGVPLRRVGEGDVIELGGARLSVFQCTSILNTNARSLVLRVTFGDSALLLCADITGEAQRDFLKRLPEGALRADVIKLPHHAITAAVPEFLDAVSPEAAVITNRRAKVKHGPISQLTSRDIDALFSGDGTVTAVTDGADWYIWQTKGEF